MNLNIYTLEEAKKSGFTTFNYADGGFDYIDDLDFSVTGFLLKDETEHIDFKDSDVFKFNPIKKQRCVGLVVKEKPDFLKDE